MDLSKYKKVKEDKQSTTMEAPGGHTITLMHAKMPRIQVEQLKRLKLAKGGAVKLSDAGNVGDASDSQQADDAPAPAPAANITINAAPAPAAAAPPAPVAASVPRQNSNDMPQAASQFAAHSPQVAVPAVPNSAPNLGANGTMDPGAVAKNTQQAAQSQQAIDTAGAQANAANQGDLVGALAQNTAQISNNYNEVKKHVDDYADYMRNHPIDRDNYLKTMGTGQKVATSLGLLLGGFTQGFHGGPNAASDWLNNQISRDIDAQKSNQAGNKNILDAYQQLYGEGAAANAAAKASLIDLYAQKANQIALQLGTPQAAVNAQKFAAQAAIEKSKALQDSAVNLNVLPGTGGASRSPQGGGMPSGGSRPSAPARAGYSPPGTSVPAGEESYDDGHILRPNATLDSVRYSPRVKDQLPAITQQFNQARQSEKALQAVNQLFPKLRDEATFSGNAASHVNPHALAAIGGGAGASLAAASALPTAGLGALGIPAATAVGAGGGEALGHAIQGMAGVTGGQQEVQYQTDKAGLTKVLAAALRGTNVSSDQIESIVEAATPSYYDSQATYAKKQGIIRDFIRQNTDTSLLEDPIVGLVKRPK